MSTILKTQPDPAHAIDELILKQQPGFSLDQDFYSEQQIFERDKRHIISRQWLFVDHESRIPAPGDYLLFEVAGESIILVRDKTGVVHAFNNVCRHRGSRVCQKEVGNAAHFICPYHAWNYSLDGKLQQARRMPPDFDRQKNGLQAFPVEVLEGLIFVRLDADKGADFSSIATSMGRYFHLHGLKQARIGERRVYRVNGNWKLVVENYLECYHCLPAHPEYCRVEAKPGRSSDGSADATRAFEDYYQAWLEQHQDWSELNRGLTCDLPMDSTLYSCQFHGGYRAPLKQGFQTSSEDGRALAPLMGEFSEYDNGETALGIGPFCFMLACNDHAVIFRFTPLTARTTDMVVTWLVAGDAKADRDFDLERLTWLWHRTTEQDKILIENNQAGIDSSWYRPGMYSELEMDVSHFIRWYLAMIGPPQALQMLTSANPGLYFRFTPG